MDKLLVKYRTFIFWGLIATGLTYVLFHKTFLSFFFQDDWYSFFISQARSPSDFLGFFKPLTNLIYYRPLGMQLPFFLVWKFFGINPLPFRIATFTIHLINGLLIYKLISYLVKNKFIAYLAGLFYLTASVHLTIFLWAATFAFVLAPLLYLSGFYFFIKNRQRLSLIILGTGLLVNENIITLPVILTVWQLFMVKNKKLKLLPLFWILAVIYGVFRLTIARFTTSGGYALLTDTRQFFFNLRNYILWSFNWPEETHKQFVSFLRLNPEFIRNFSGYVAVFSGSMIIMGLFLFIIPWVVLIVKKRLKPQTVSLAVFGILWFGLTLSPVLYFAKHYFAYYLAIPIFGILLTGSALTGDMLSFMTHDTKNKYCLILVTVFMGWYIASWQNIRLNSFIHWAFQRAYKSEKLVKKIKYLYPVLPPDAVIVVGEDPGTEESKWALGDQSGMQVIYDNPRLKTIYVNKQEYLTSRDTLFLPPQATGMISL